MRMLAIVAAMSAAWFASAEDIITAEPDHIRFSKLEDSAVIHVFRNGDPLPVKAIRSVRAVIGNNNYSHHFNIAKNESGTAAITVSPNPAQAQAGTFTLVISTKYGDALVAVDMPLDQLPDSLENRAKAEGITVEELKLKLGLSKPGQRETISVRLPQWQYEGTTFTLRVPSPSGREFVWRVNGNVVEQGPDKNTLSYVLNTVGDHQIDMEARQGEGIVAQWSGTLRVIPYPDMRIEVRPKEPVVLRAPRGFDKHHWIVDGRNAGNHESLRQSFSEPGEHIIECMASDPILGNPGEYRRMVWKVNVVPPPRSARNR